MEQSQAVPNDAPVSTPVEGLFPKLAKPSSPAASDAPAPSADWYLMEGVAGQGQRPEFLSPKYKTLADQAKAYTELEKKLGVQKAPENYDLSKYENVLPSDDEKTQKILHFAREKQLGQDVVDGFLDVFAEHVAGQKIDYSKEIEKLGANGREMITTVATWANNTLSPESLETINRIGHTADVVKMLDELRQFQFHSSSQVPVPGQVNTGFIPLSVAEVEAEMMANYSKYMEDPRYRAEIKAKFEQAVG